MGYSMNVEKCERCGEPTNGITTMSMFNTEVICMKCKEAEKLRPDYNKAVEADVAEIKKGNYNFEGIGFAKGGGVGKYYVEMYKRFGGIAGTLIEKDRKLDVDTQREHFLLFNSEQEAMDSIDRLNKENVGKYGAHLISLYNPKTEDDRDQAGDQRERERWLNQMTGKQEHYHSREKGGGFAKGGGVERTEIYVLGKDKKYADEAFKRAGIKPSKISEKQDEITYGVDGIYTYYFSNITDRERAFSYLHGLFAKGGAVESNPYEDFLLANGFIKSYEIKKDNFIEYRKGRWYCQIDKKTKEIEVGKYEFDYSVDDVRKNGGIREDAPYYHTDKYTNSLSGFKKFLDNNYILEVEEFANGGELPSGIITKGQIQKVYKAAGFDTEKIRRTRLNDGWFVYYKQASPYFHASGVVSDWIPDDDAVNMMEMYLLEARSRHKMPSLSGDDLRNIFLSAGVEQLRVKYAKAGEVKKQYTSSDYEQAAYIINNEINIGNIPYFRNNRNKIIEPLAQIISDLREQGILPQNYNQHESFNDYLAGLKIYKPVDGVYEMEMREPVEMLATGGEVKSLDDEIKKIDWSFQFSDDFRYWQSGESHRKKVSKMIAEILKNNPELYEQIRKKMWASYRKQYTSKEDIWGIDSVMEDAKAGRVSMAKGGNVSKAAKYEAEMQALYKRKMKYADGGNVYLHDYKVGDVLKQKIPADVNPAVKKYLMRMQKTKKITGIDYTDGSVEINNRPFDKMKISWLDWLIQNEYEYIPA